MPAAGSASKPLARKFRAREFTKLGGAAEILTPWFFGATSADVAADGVSGAFSLGAVEVVIAAEVAPEGVSGAFAVGVVDVSIGASVALDGVSGAFAVGDAVVAVAAYVVAGPARKSRQNTFAAPDGVVVRSVVGTVVVTTGPAAAGAYVLAAGVRVSSATGVAGVRAIRNLADEELIAAVSALFFEVD